MRDLPGFHDGDTGPVYRFRAKDDGSAVDQSIVAVEMYVYDNAGTLLARRAALPVSPKSSGFLDLMLLGRECDWLGLGKDLVLKPKVYALVAPDGSAATNLLLNPSFDTDAGADGVADSWAMQGAKVATWAILNDDPFPPVIFGSTQRVKHAGLVDTDYILQTAAATIAAGDRYSFGVWHRSDGVGGTPADTHAIVAKLGASTPVVSRFRVGTNDWYFVTGSVYATQAETSWSLWVDGRGTTLDNRYDDAFLGKGDWRTIPVEPYRLPVAPRSVPAKTTNQVAGVGSFEQDSDGDGFADGWSKANAAGATFAMEYNPANVHVGRASQKLTVAALSGKFVRHIRRARYVSGETWRATVRVKTNGALAGAPTTGQWALRVSTDNFQDVAPQQNGSIADFGTNLGTFTLYQSDIVLAATVDALRIDVNLNGVTGAAWIDDVQLFKV